MNNYLLGGWTQLLHATPPASFSYTMYGMITNLDGLTSGTPSAPGWSPAKHAAPTVPNGKVLWTYGGGGCTPRNMPDNGNITDIINATNTQHWDGVDFDDECYMNAGNIISCMQSLKPLSTSYTFLAGWAYNNPDSDPSGLGKSINQSVEAIAGSGACDRFILMCYGSAMWSMSDIQANVGPAIDRTIKYTGDPSQVILALTPKGLTDENLNYFLDQVTGKGIGGLFVWDFNDLSSGDLATIEAKLGLGQVV